MTVHEIAQKVAPGTEIRIAYNGSSTNLDITDLLQMDAFGMYEVENFSCFENAIEINLKTQLVKHQ